MDIKNEHFEIIKQKDYLYIIKENISLVHPVYTNDPLNLYLLLGSRKALLMDTGCGLFPLKPIVEKIIEERDLIVLNTHTHWDHILGNREFGEIYVHENELTTVSKPYDLWFLRESPCEIIQNYEKDNFLIPPAEKINPLKDNHVFDLGDITATVIHCPGHSPGSICLLTNKNELFTSDVAYYGDTFLPNRDNFPQVLNSLSKLTKICQEKNISELYPSHREYPCDITLLTDLYEGINNLENIWESRERFDFFQAWKLDDNSGKFIYYISRV